jgi:hypothetical protein
LRHRVHVHVMVLIGGVLFAARCRTNARPRWDPCAPRLRESHLGCSRSWVLSFPSANAIAAAPSDRAHSSSKDRI